MYAEKKHGHGILTWPDGRMYTGAFYADQRHGFGNFQTPDISEFRVNIFSFSTVTNSSSGFVPLR